MFALKKDKWSSAHQNKDSKKSTTERSKILQLPNLSIHRRALMVRLRFMLLNRWMVSDNWLLLRELYIALSTFTINSCSVFSLFSLSRNRISIIFSPFNDFSFNCINLKLPFVRSFVSRRTPSLFRTWWSKSFAWILPGIWLSERSLKTLCFIQFRSSILPFG